MDSSYVPLALAQAKLGITADTATDLSHQFASRLIKADTHAVHLSYSHGNGIPNPLGITINEPSYFDWGAVLPTSVSSW